MVTNYFDFVTNYFNFVTNYFHDGIEIRLMGPIGNPIATASFWEKCAVAEDKDLVFGGDIQERIHLFITKIRQWQWVIWLCVRDILDCFQKRNIGKFDDSMSELAITTVESSISRYLISLTKSSVLTVMYSLTVVDGWFELKIWRGYNWRWDDRPKKNAYLVYIRESISTARLRY